MGIGRGRVQIEPDRIGKFLGHRMLLNGNSPKSVQPAKETIRQITRRNRGVSFAQVIVKLNRRVPPAFGRTRPPGKPSAVSGKGPRRLANTPQVNSAMSESWFESQGLGSELLQVAAKAAR